MGFRVRRSIRLFPGVRLNVSKSGFSTSVGGSGLTLNMGKRGARYTVGLPGTGLSYTDRLIAPQCEYSQPAEALARTRAGARPVWIVAALVMVAALFFAIGFIPAGQSGPAKKVDTSAMLVQTSLPVASVDASALRCRTTPNRNGMITAKLSKGEEVSVLESGPEWTLVRAREAECWVSTPFLNLRRAPNSI